jgi:hypothetical protein
MQVVQKAYIPKYTIITYQLITKLTALHLPIKISDTQINKKLKKGKNTSVASIF